MIIKRIVRSEADGVIEATLMLSQEQASFLMNYALSELVQKGVAQVMDYTEEEFKNEAKPASAPEGLSNQQGASGQPEGDPAEPQSATTVSQNEPQPATEGERLVSHLQGKLDLHSPQEQQKQREFLESVDVENLHKA